jgi:DNA ligase-1
MLAKPTTGILAVLEKLGNAKFTCEFKYDGERAQIHYDGGKTKIFSRNSEDNTGKYPDIILDTIPQILKGTTKNAVLDGEIVAYDKEKKEILPFQKLQTRKRKEVSSEDIKVQVCYFAFDCLHLNGKSLLQSSLTERRDALEEACQEVEGKFYFAKGRTSGNVEDLEGFLQESIEAKTEGLMVKTLESTYEPSQRSNNWLKLKKDYMDGMSDSVDLVVVGAWKGKGKRVGKYGAYLLACYNDDTEEFETIGKTGTGFKDEDLEACFKQMNEHVIECPRPYYKWGEKLKPDVWFDASVVWEVKAADLTISPVYKAAIGLADDDRGISLRFPRFLTARADKTPTSCTNSQEIYQLFLDQGQFKAAKKDEDASGSDEE